MLERVKIQNFRCIKNLEVELRPLTVLVGPNDTGKSAFVAAIRALFAGGAQSRLNHWNLDLHQEIYLWGVGGDCELKLAPRGTKFHARSGQRDYAVEATKEHGDVFHGAPAFHELPSGGPLMHSPGHTDEGSPPKLGTNGGGVPSLVDWLLRRDRPRFDEFVQAMRDRVPGLVEINVGTPDAGSRRLDLKIESGLEIPADNASVGVRLMLFFVALTYHPSPPGIILIEEPENGVHPRRLADIMSLLRDITKGIHCGHPAQVILTTHSPYLLDHVDLDQDQVLVFRRDDDGSRTAEPVNAERLKTFLDEFMLGEVWFNEQEEGLTRRGD